MRRLDFDTLGSTNDTALELAGKYPHQALLIVAATQHGGRGRNGRAWSSPRGGAWLSVVWPCKLALEHYEPAPLLAGLAVIDAIAPHLPPGCDPAIKWPNDVMLDNCKLAGVLCQRQVAAGPTTTHQAAPLVVGIGINVNIDPEQLGANLRQPATSLRQVTGHDVDLSALIDSVAANLAQRMQRLEAGNFSPSQVAEVENRLIWRGKQVNFLHAGASKQGWLRGLDTQGRLLLEIDGGMMTLNAGEIQQLAKV